MDGSLILQARAGFYIKRLKMRRICWLTIKNNTRILLEERYADILGCLDEEGTL